MGFGVIIVILQNLRYEVKDECTKRKLYVWNCTVFKKSSGYPGLLFFHAATLNSPELFKPQKVFWGSSSQPWDYVNSKLEVMKTQ